MVRPEPESDGAWFPARPEAMLFLGGRCYDGSVRKYMVKKTGKYFDGKEVPNRSNPALLPYMFFFSSIRQHHNSWGLPVARIEQIVGADIFHGVKHAFPNVRKVLF